MNPTHKTIADDLTKPVVSAAFVGLVMTLLDDAFTKRQRLLIFGLMAIGGTLYLSWYRSHGED